MFHMFLFNCVDPLYSYDAELIHDAERKNRLISLILRDKTVLGLQCNGTLLLIFGECLWLSAFEPGELTYQAGAIISNQLSQE
jgi:hypothetical protein